MEDVDISSGIYCYYRHKNIENYNAIYYSGEGNKIYFKYRIMTPYIEEISFEEEGHNITLVQIEEKIVRAYKNNCTLLKINCNEDLEALRYTVRYCNSFIRKPKILINLQNFSNIYPQISEIINGYKGEIEIIY